jgi:hypothetical protein
MLSPIRILILKIYVHNEISHRILACWSTFRRLLHIILNGKHVIVLYAKSQSLDCSFSLKRFILSFLITADILVDIGGE